MLFSTFSLPWKWPNSIFLPYIVYFWYVFMSVGVWVGELVGVEVSRDILSSRSILLKQLSILGRDSSLLRCRSLQIFKKRADIYWTPSHAKYWPGCLAILGTQRKGCLLIRTQVQNKRMEVEHLRIQPIACIHLACISWAPIMCLRHWAAYQGYGDEQKESPVGADSVAGEWTVIKWLDK